MPMWQSVRGARQRRQASSARRRSLQLEPLESRQLLAGVRFLGNLSTNPRGSDPQQVVEVGGMAFFSATTDDITRDLWGTDGTAGGTRLIKDFQNRYLDHLTNVGGTLFFTASEPASGRELWKSDGTEAGTVQVLDIYPGDVSSYLYELTDVSGTAFFYRRGYGDTNWELWKSTGTGAGTVRLHTFATESFRSRLADLTNVDGTLFFQANDTTHGTELWKTDGTVSGTRLVREIAPGVSSSNPTSLANVAGQLYFAADDGQSGSELWTSDGTFAGTVKVADIAPGAQSSNPTGLVNRNGEVFFAANGESGMAMWKSNGAVGGTVKLSDVGTSSVPRWPVQSVNAGDAVFFVFSDDIDEGFSLWKSDGSASGTSPLLTNFNQIDWLVGMGDAAYFSGNSKLWKSDGTKAGTIAIRETTPDGRLLYPSALANVGGRLIFAGREASYGSGELWKSDGTPAGTSLFKNLVTGTVGWSPDKGVNVNGTLFFGGPTTGFSESLWKSDGTVAGTQPIKTDFTYFLDYTAANFKGELYFAASAGDADIELWKSDGTKEGTVRVKDLYFGGRSYPESLTNVNGTLFFVARNQEGNGLWRSDGTADGTVLIKSIPSFAEAFGSTGVLTNISGTLFFSAGEADDIELWKSDGTPQGTFRVKDIAAGSSRPLQLTNVNGTLFFHANDGNQDRLWKSDGTEARTVVVTDKVSHPRYLVNVAGSLFFSGSGEIWKTEGTDGGTIRLTDNKPQGGGPWNLTNVGGLLLFDAYDNVYGRQMWRSDGTPAGTRRIRAVPDGQVNNTFSPTVNVDGKLYFSVATSHARPELWSTDGTYAGTVKVYEDVAREKFEAGGNLFFSAFTPEYGTELYAVPPDSNRAPVLNTTPDTRLWSIDEDRKDSPGTPISLLVDGVQTDLDADAQRGIAITAATGEGFGRWQFSLNKGRHWRWLGNVSETDARLLPSSDQTRLRFVPYKNFNGQLTLSYRAWDQTQGTAGGLFDLTEHTGGRHAFSLAVETALLNVKPVNDAPLIAVGGPVSYVRDAAAILLAPAAKVVDVDSANFSGGSLRVHIDSGASVANRLAIGGNFTIDSSNNVLLWGKIIGRRTKTGWGNNDLVVVFNANATPSIVQRLAQSITFKTVGGEAGERRLLFSLGDGDGGWSPRAEKMVDVT